MANIATKNPFDLLGDDSEPSQAQAPAKTDKSAPKVAQRAPPKPAQHDSRQTRGGSRGHREGATGNEAAFRDRGAGSQQNRNRGTDETRGEYRGRGRGRGRGGRGGRGGAPSDDRHSKTGVVDHEKQVGHGWGEKTGSGEWADEQAGQAIAQAEEKATEREDADNQNGNADAEAAEEEAKTKTYDDYLAEQAEKRANIASALEIRKANEGASKKLPQGKEFAREEEGEFISGTSGKKARERAKKEKNLLELDGDAMRQTDRAERRGRGGRGGSGAPRGDFVPRGGERGGRGRGDGSRGRGEFRGRGRGAYGSNAPNVSDESAFPSLGS
jgi:plasminogen activator inhibitor 1 RNA-binding protein